MKRLVHVQNHKPFIIQTSTEPLTVITPVGFRPARSDDKDRGILEGEFLSLSPGPGSNRPMVRNPAQLELPRGTPRLCEKIPLLRSRVQWPTATPECQTYPCQYLP